MIHVLTQLELRLIDVNSNDPGGSCSFATHNSCKTNSSQAKNSTVAAHLHLLYSKELILKLNMLHMFKKPWHYSGLHRSRLKCHSPTGKHG